MNGTVLPSSSRWTTASTCNLRICRSWAMRDRSRCSAPGGAFGIRDVCIVQPTPGAGGRGFEIEGAETSLLQPAYSSAITPGCQVAKSAGCHGSQGGPACPPGGGDRQYGHG